MEPCSTLYLMLHLHKILQKTKEKLENIYSSPKYSYKIILFFQVFFLYPGLPAWNIQYFLFLTGSKNLRRMFANKQCQDFSSQTVIFARLMRKKKLLKCALMWITEQIFSRFWEYLHTLVLHRVNRYSSQRWLDNTSSPFLRFVSEKQFSYCQFR